MIKINFKYYPVALGVREDLNFLKYHPADATLLATIANSGFAYAGSIFDGVWSGLNYDWIDEEARWFLKNSLWDGPEDVRDKLIDYLNEWYDDEIYDEDGIPFDELSDADFKNMTSDYLRKCRVLDPLLRRAVYDVVDDGDLDTYLDNWYNDYLSSSEVNSMKAEINSMISDELDSILQTYNCEGYTIYEEGLASIRFKNISDSSLEDLKTDLEAVKDKIKSKVAGHMKDIIVYLPNGFMLCERVVGEFDIALYWHVLQN